MLYRIGRLQLITRCVVFNSAGLMAALLAVALALASSLPRRIASGRAFAVASGVSLNALRCPGESARNPSLGGDASLEPRLDGKGVIHGGVGGIILISGLVKILGGATKFSNARLSINGVIV